MDIYSALEISYYCSKLIGLSPYHLVGKKPGGRHFEISKSGYAYSIFVIFSVLTLEITIHSNVNDSGLASVSLVAYVILIQYHADFIVSVFALVRGCVTAKRVVIFFRRVDRIDKICRSMKIAVPYAGQRIFSVWQALFVVTSTLGAFVYIYTTISPIGIMMNTFWSQLFWLFYFVPKLLCAVFHSKFIEGVMIVRTRFKLLNNSLENLILEETNRRSGVAWVKKSPPKGLTTPQQVDFFSTSHEELCELAEEHNSIYSFQTLFYIASAFATMITRLNSVFRGIVRRESHPKLLFVHGIFSLCVLFFYSVQMVWLAVACTLCANEANRTATYVHKLLQHTRYDAVKEKLHLFSLQLLHYKLQFTACQMFPIDATLIYAIVGGVTTYLIILTQFEVSSGQSQEKFLGIFNSTT